MTMSMPSNWRDINRQADEDFAAEERWNNRTPLVDACVREYGLGHESLVLNHSKLESLARNLERRLRELE